MDPELAAAIAASLADSQPAEASPKQNDTGNADGPRLPGATVFSGAGQRLGGAATAVVPGQNVQYVILDVTQCVVYMSSFLFTLDVIKLN